MRLPIVCFWAWIVSRLGNERWQKHMIVMVAPKPKGLAKHSQLVFYIENFCTRHAKRGSQRFSSETLPIKGLLSEAIQFATDISPMM